MPNDNDLFHWGIPGMRWGVRKDKSSYASLSRTQKKNAKLLKKMEKQGKSPKMDDDGERLREVSPRELRKREKLAKKAGLNTRPKIDDDGERLEIDYEKSKHLKKPEPITKPSKNDKPKSDISKNDKSKNNKTNDKSKDDKTDKKTKDEMSTKELKAEIARIKAEREYDNLTNPKQPNPEKVRLERAADKAKTTSEVLNTTKSGFDSASNIARTIGAEARKVPSKEVKEQLSQMTNKEIRDRIERIRLENEYASLNPSKQAIAAERTAAVLQGVGHLAAVGSSIASIASAMNQYKARRLD